MSVYVCGGAHDIGVCHGHEEGGPSQSVKWFLCSLCVSATVGSTCVNDTPLSFIVHEVRGFGVTWAKHSGTLIQRSMCSNRGQ